MNKLSTLNELKYFINGVSSIHSTRGPLPADVGPQLVKSSLNLLENLPAAREVILEYFAMVFDSSVGNYINTIEKDPNGTPPEDDTISDIQESLEKLVTKGPPAWAPLISSWSLRNLGTLSNKYSRGRAMDIGSSCTLWLGSNAMRCLLGLAAACFGKLNSIETEECISTLLATFVKNSPHFDWVVARLGGCFPLKVMSKILQCGLKGFVGNFNSTLDSEVGILGYLSFAHESDLKFALKEMFQTVLFQPVTSVQPHANTIPYLLHLCSMSEILLQPIVSVFLELFNDSIISTLVEQSKMWPPNFNARDIVPSLSTLVMKLKEDATKTVMTLARISQTYLWCQEFLENILQELEALVLDDRTCPLLDDVIKDDSKRELWKSCHSEHIFEQQTAVRLLLLVCTQTPFVYYETIAELLHHSYELKNHGFGALARLLGGSYGNIDTVAVKPGFNLAFERILFQRSNKQPEDAVHDLNIFKNMVALLKWESQAKATPYLRMLPVSMALIECVSKLLEIFDSYLKAALDQIDVDYLSSDGGGCGFTEKRLKKSDITIDAIDDELKMVQIRKDQVHVLANLLNKLEFGGNDNVLNMINIVKLAQLAVKYFFFSLNEKNPAVRAKAANLAFTMLSRQCAVRKSSRTIALRELLEGALFQYGHMFEATDDEDSSQKRGKQGGGNDLLLLKLNQRQGVSRTNVWHSGVIGGGVKAEPAQPTKISEELENLFLGAITACCKSEDMPTTIDGFSTVSLLLVEIVSPDVMYNGLPWPDEELFTKVTMERDLQIRRTFKNAPILWPTLALIAAYRPAICFASVLLRAICASVLHQWRAKMVDKYQTVANHRELYQVTGQLLEILAMGQLLPPPLNYIHTIIEYLDPPEISVVLKECVWNYLKENVPSPVLYGVDGTGLHWRDSVAAKPYPQFVDPLRKIMQRKLPILGAHYHHMFVMAELNDVAETTVTAVEQQSTVVTLSSASASSLLANES